MREFLRTRVLPLVEHLSGNLLTYTARPLRAKDYRLAADKVETDAKIAIVIQGPLVATEDFTLETVRIYKKIFPHDCIIVSTWDDQPAEQLNILHNEGVTVLLNTKPERPGISNINYQIVSTLAGIKAARAEGATHILKTRSDQRLYAPNARSFLLALLETFPPANMSPQKRRIVACSLNTFKYRPYSISDMFLFGVFEDMECYWDIPLEPPRSLPPNFANASLRAWSKERLCEVYLSAHYIETLGETPDWTLRDSWRVYGTYFIVTDANALDLYWYKYEREKERKRTQYDALKNDQELDFKEWLMLYIRQGTPKHIPEEVCDMPIGKSISI